MDDDKLVEQMESQLQEALHHLSSVVPGDPKAQFHRLSARRAYDSIMEVLPKVALSGKRRVSFLTQLSEVKKKLTLAGEEL